MSSFQNSNDDFFNNPLSSAPKQSTRLTQTRAKALTGGKPASRATTASRRAPPPPRSKAGSADTAATTTTATTAAAAVGSANTATPSSNAATTTAGRRPTRRRPTRLPAPSAQTLSNKSTPAGSTVNSNLNTAATSTPAVTSKGFYNNTAATNTNTKTTTTSGNNNNAMGGNGFYNYNAPAPTAAAVAVAAPSSSTSGGNQWDSWAAPAPSAATATANPQQQQPQQQQQTNQWQATAPAATQLPQSAAASSNDWYGGGSPMDPSSFADAPAPTNPSPAADSFSQWQTPSAGASMQGSMDSSAPQPTQAQSQPSIFQPGAFFGGGASTGGNTTTTMNYDSTNTEEDDFENEAPLLEELGIRFDHIALKTKTVCWPFKRTQTLEGSHKDDMVDAVVQDADVIGPICYCLLLGGEMVLTGKLQFGYIYGFALFGCVAMTLIVNLTAPQDAVSFWVVSSVLGYALIPVNILALVKIVIINLASLQKLGRILGLITVIWSTTASTRLLEIGCGLRKQRYLIAYPIALLYSAFVLITIF